MQLTEDQLDVVKEIFNIGTGKAAKALSDMVGTRVEISMPNIEVLGAEELREMCLSRIQRHCSLITQPFYGDMRGQVYLLLPDDSASTLVNVLTHENEIEDLAEVDETALLEIGNIMINGCLTGMANLLGRRLQFVFPRVTIQPPEVIAERIQASSTENENLVLMTEFTLLDKKVWGLFVISMPMESLNIMMDAVAEYLEGGS